MYFSILHERNELITELIVSILNLYTNSHYISQLYAGGAWLVAYKAEQRRRFKAVLCREPDVSLSDKNLGSKQSSKLRKADGSETKRKLDGIYLVNCSN